MTLTQLDLDSLPYCLSNWKTVRFKTREVMVGKVGVGGTTLYVFNR